MKSNFILAKRSSGLSHAEALSMRTARVDQVSSLLLSLILLFGISVVVLGILFSMGESVQAPDLAPKPVGTAFGSNGKGMDQGLDVPSREEVEQLNEPAVEQFLKMVEEVISNVGVSIESIDAQLNADSSGNGTVGIGPAVGEGNGSGIAPRNERWMLKFTARDKRNYARQLETFKISIGAIGGGIATVDTISNVATEPSTSSGASKDFRGVLYFMSATSNVLEQYERQMLQAAGVPVAGRHVLKFVPRQTEELLALTEAKYYLEKRGSQLNVAEIAKTVFECRPKKDASGYEFVVVEQRYKAR
jgi:hypothetical protein